MSDYALYEDASLARVGSVSDLDRHAMPRRHPNPRYREASGDIGDLISSGHASTGNVLVETFVRPMPPRQCRVCTRPIWHPSERWICEFSGGEYVTLAPSVGNGRRCECSWCEIAQHCQPVGRPPEICGDAACRREDQRREKAAQRSRRYERERLLAVEVIRYEPYRTNRDIADQLGIPALRVKQARLEICPA